MTDTIFDQINADAARDYNPDPDPRRPTTRKEADDENKPGDFKIEATDAEKAAIRRTVAAARPLPAGFKDEPF